LNSCKNYAMPFINRLLVFQTLQSSENWLIMVVRLLICGFTVVWTFFGQCVY